MSAEAKSAKPPRILSIAGSDSSGGAGIQADLKTITMLGGYGMSAVTTITAQNSVGVTAIAPMNGDIVHKQIMACIDDIGVDAVKIGMLHDTEIIASVNDALAALAPGTPVILDPVMIATSGAALIAPEAVAAMREELFPKATLITPNLPELEHLADRTLHTSELMANAADALAGASGAAILAKGGHTEDARIIDLLMIPKEDGGCRAVSFNHARIDTPHTHGTGCTLSAAVATLMGHGQPLENAVRLARQFVFQAITHAPGYGAGNGPLGHQAVRSLE